MITTKVDKATYHFRELTTPDDLLSYFKLRARVYKLSGYCDKDIDVDTYDPYCGFVGVFAGEEMIGGARYIMSEGSPRPLPPEAPDPGPRVRPFQFSETFDLNAIKEYASQRGWPLVEFGRAVIAPEFRSAGLGLRLVHALHGLARSKGIRVGFAGVFSHLKTFYVRAGCRLLENKGSSTVSHLKGDLWAMVVDLDRLNGPFRAAYRAQDEMERHGRWTVCSSPDCEYEHRHGRGVESLWQQLQELPGMQSHGWEPPSTRLPLLRPGLLLHDETMRDGLQCTSVQSPKLEAKFDFLQRLCQLGVETANLGLPSAGGWMRQHTEELVAEVVRQKLPLAMTCAGRTVESDVAAIADIAQRTGAQLEAGLFLGCSPLRQSVEGWDIKTLIKWTEASISLAVSQGLTVMFVTEDTVRTPPEVLEPLYHTAILAGASGICLTDTVGHATPSGTRRVVRFARDFLLRHGYEARLDWHGHSDRGLAVANCLAAIEAGVDRVHGTVLGVGERVGNVPLDRLLLHLHRLTGRTLQRSALARYIEWGRRVLRAPVPADLQHLAILEEQQVEEGSLVA